MNDFLTTSEVARIFGISDARVRQLIYAGVLPAEKVGNMNLVRRGDLPLLNDRRNGRPRKITKELASS